MSVPAASVELTSTTNTYNQAVFTAILKQYDMPKYPKNQGEVVAQVVTLWPMTEPSSGRNEIGCGSTSP